MDSCYHPPITYTLISTLLEPPSFPNCFPTPYLAAGASLLLQSQDQHDAALSEKIGCPQFQQIVIYIYVVYIYKYTCSLCKLLQLRVFPIKTDNTMHFSMQSWDSHHQSSVSHCPHHKNAGHHSNLATNGTIRTCFLQHCS